MSASPGPWTFIDVRILRAPAYPGESEHDRLVALVYSNDPVGKTQNRPDNGALIKAAPDLLEACERALAAFDAAPSTFVREHTDAVAWLRGAIASANEETK